MTPRQVHLVQRSFSAIQPNAVAAGETFYTILLRENPELQPLFSKADIQEQGFKLMAMLGMLVHSLERPATILPAIRAMGRRHRGYGAEARDYQQVGRALIETLAGALASAFTPEVRTAWETVYAFVAGEMISASVDSDAHHDNLARMPQMAG